MWAAIVYHVVYSLLISSGNPQVFIPCPSVEWRLHQGQCYLFDHTPEKDIKYWDWDRSRDSCRARGSDLVTIVSAEENEFLRQNMVSYIAWTGLYRQGDEIRSVGNHVDELGLYKNWGHNQPSGNKDTNCVQLKKNGHLVMANCNIALPHICKVEEGSYMYTNATTLMTTPSITQDGTIVSSTSNETGPTNITLPATPAVHNEGHSTSAKVGIAIGVVVTICVCCGVLIWVYTHRHRKGNYAVAQNDEL